MQLLYAELKHTIIYLVFNIICHATCYTKPRLYVLVSSVASGPAPLEVGERRQLSFSEQATQKMQRKNVSCDCFNKQKQSNKFQLNFDSS